MRVLYIINDLGIGGAERSLAALAPHYPTHGAELEIAYLRPTEGLHAEFEAAGARLFDLSGPRGRLGWIERCTRLIRARRPDVVHTTLFEADVAGRVAATLARVPSVTSLVNVSYTDGHVSDPHLRPWKVRAAQLSDMLTARRAARFHAITSYVADEMARRLRIERSRIDVVPRGRDPEILGRRTDERRRRMRDGLGIDESTPVVLAAARHEYQKGLDVLLRAFPAVLSAIPRARLLVAGRDGNQTRELVEIVERRGLGSSVEFLGERSDVPDLLSAADLFVLPSRWEGLGSILIEAMALEAPIVASDLGPVREALGGDQTARLVSPEEEAALGDAVVSMLEDPEGRVDMTERAYERFRDHFTIDRVAEGMIRFYRRALEMEEVAA